MAAAEQGSDAPGGLEPGASRQFALAGLELLQIAADDAEIAVIEGAHGLYHPLIEKLIEAELDGVESEPGPDMSRAPG
jgi:hypothetical protein